jgi:alpha-L-fucosidase 2
MLGGFTQSYLPLGDLLIDFDTNEEYDLLQRAEEFSIENKEPERGVAALRLSGKRHGSARKNSARRVNNIWNRYESAAPAEDYRRSLNLATAIHQTSFRRGGVRYEMEPSPPHPAQALFLRLNADRSGALNFTLRLTSPLRHVALAQEGRIDLDVLAPSDVVPSYLDCPDPVRYHDEPERRGMRCRASARLIVDAGRVRAAGGALTVSGASEAVVVLVARTSFSGFNRHPYLDGEDEIALCQRDLALLSGVSYKKARYAHVLDHRALFDRASLSLGEDSRQALPTDERLRALQDHPEDTAFYAYIFDFARYLMIAASRPGTQPMNLQGIWSRDTRAIWSCNYTLNINLQMNYWPAEAANLPELHEPLFDLVDRLSATGRETARLHYGARGRGGPPQRRPLGTFKPGG